MAMIFPTDPQDRLAYVSFTVSQDEGTDFSGQADMPPVSESTENIVDKEEQKDDRNALEKFFDFNDDGELSLADVRAGYDKAKEQINKVNDFLGSAGDAVEGILNDFFGMGGDRQPFKRGRTEFADPDGNVVLFLPPGFQSTEGLGFDGFDLGLAGSIAERTFQNGGFDNGGVLGDAFKTTTGTLEEIKAGSLPDTAKLLSVELAKLKRAALPAGVGAAANAVGGVTVAPNQRTLFKRVNMREFAFTFSLIPSNAEEAAIVTQIAKYFRYYLYPKPILSNDGVRIGYQYPNKFQIKVGSVLPGGWEPIKIQPCYLRGLSVTTNPNAAAYHKDGNPVETQISVNFIESATLDRDQEEYVEPPSGGGVGGGRGGNSGVNPNQPIPASDPVPGAGPVPGASNPPVTQTGGGE